MENSEEGSMEEIPINVREREDEEITYDRLPSRWKYTITGSLLSAIFANGIAIASVFYMWRFSECP